MPTAPATTWTTARRTVPHDRGPRRVRPLPSHAGADTADLVYEQCAYSRIHICGALCRRQREQVEPNTARPRSWRHGTTGVVQFGAGAVGMRVPLRG